MKYLKVISLLLLMLLPVWLMPDGATVRDFKEYKWISEFAPLWGACLLFLAAIGCLLYVWNEMERIAGYLALAEREYNDMLGGATDHGGRKGRVAERYEWNALNMSPAIQVNMAGYRSVAHELIAENEKEVQGKRAASGRASLTGFLLRELYEASVGAAQRKVLSEAKNGGTPHIAAGIRELIGFNHFDPNEGFKKNAGVNSHLLEWTVKFGGYPRNLRLAKTKSDGTKEVLTGWDVLIDQGFYPSR